MNADSVPTPPLSVWAILQDADRSAAETESRASRCLRQIAPHLTGPDYEREAILDPDTIRGLLVSLQDRIQRTGYMMQELERALAPTDPEVAVAPPGGRGVR